MPSRKFRARTTKRRTLSPAVKWSWRVGEVDNPEDRRATTPREITHFLIRSALVFTAVIGLPTFVAHAVHKGGMPDVSSWLHTKDAKLDIRVYDVPADSTTTIPLNTYVLGVLAAEFSPDASMESLKAAAVATRTYAVHALTTNATSGSMSAQKNADVTNDSSLDLPLDTESDIQAEFPGQAYQFISRLQAAIEETDGMVVAYQQKPILAFMFDESGGTTRSSQAAIGKDIPYLRQVNCPDDAADPNRISVNTLNYRDIAQAFNIADVTFQDLKLKRGADGFVLSVAAAGHTISGADFANALNLPSANFTWKQVSSGVAITSYGRGTSIGMSLHEAESLSHKGMQWKAIISHFYPGTSIEQDDGFLSHAKISLTSRI